jgi:hypothetical protein
MPRTWTDQYTFLAGAVATPGLVYFVTHDDEVAEARVPYSSFLTWREGEWLDGGTREWPTVSVASIPGDMTQLIAIGEGGQVFLKGAGEEREELVVKGDEGPATRGPLRAVRAVGGQVLAVGSDRQIYRRKGPSRWEAFDHGLRPEGVPAKPEPKKPAGPRVRHKGPIQGAAKRPVAPAAAAGFEAVDGFSASEIYAVGRRGEIWQLDAGRWVERDSPTTDTLCHITCTADEVYLATDKGAVLRGRGERWEKLAAHLSEPILGLRVFDGTLYASTKKGLYRRDQDQFVPVPLPKKDPPKTFGMLDVSRAALWSIGGKDIFTFDGKSWERIE